MVDFKKIREQSIRLARRNVRSAFAKDLLVIQSISCIDEIDKVSGVLVNRVREWYGYYNPEFTKAIHSNDKFIELIISKSRQELLKSLKIPEDASMGADFEGSDIVAVLALAKSVQGLFELRKSYEDYLAGILEAVCPNVMAVAGTLLSAKLVMLAGSLKRLSEMPASTIQLLGAEKALFRHIRGQGKSPKHGVLVQHALMEGSRLKDRGRIARAIADKISIAAKVDYFKGKFMGDRLRAALEMRFQK